LYPSGPIPAELGPLAKLEQLYLRGNKLTSTFSPLSRFTCVQQYEKRFAFHPYALSFQLDRATDAYLEFFILSVLTVFCGIVVQLFDFRCIRRKASIGIETSEVPYWNLNVITAGSSFAILFGL
jgi:hypothetical protein